MKITIQGQDYTAALDAAHPLTIARTLNEPSVCRLWLSLPADGSLAAPVRYQPLAVTGDDGTAYFTGYIAVSPLPEYAGVSLRGPRYRIAIEAISDELLLDQRTVAVSKTAAGVTAGSLLSNLVEHTGATNLSTAGLTLTAPVAHFDAEPGAPWSKSTGLVASGARAAYRAVNGALTVAAAQSTVHPLNETDGSLTLASLTLNGTAKRALANDVTVCGAAEPQAYVTEHFLGDGTTTQFFLAEDPYFPPASKSILIHELFNEPAINAQLWTNSGGAGYLTLGANGLSMQGGNGIDGDTMLTWMDPMEMAGTLLLEAAGVQLAAGSTGIIAGMFTGTDTLASCTAGFQATAASGTGTVTLQPVVQGVATGTTYTVNPANQYALRVRVHCPETARGGQVYSSYDDNGVVTYGGTWNLAPGKLLFELQEFVNGVGGMPVALYDGVVANLPGTCQVAAVSSLNLQGSMRELNLTQLGSGWVVCTPSGGTAYTRRVGSTAQGGECHLLRTGKLVFYTGFAPPAGEQIAVSYRTVGRAVGRAVNAASQQSMAAAGLPSVAAWMGSVTNPAARSSADCRSAAQALAQAAASVSALWSGTYKGPRTSFAADVWPGDALLLQAPSTNLNAQVVVRTVKVSYTVSAPEQVEYAMTFANDWAEDLAIKMDTKNLMDTWLPALVNPTFAANLSGLAVTAMSGATVTLATGATAPVGGGFEIRRRDWCFQPGEDTDLVMRASVSTLTFTRVAASDRYYIRMYDGATPPNYSEFSAALFFNLPLA
ncbi:MAG: hypothetical protein KGJ51_02135 [Acidobacteriota bacterium]|nr:hypothetical protein [Acidobacteriota bacterium]